MIDLSRLAEAVKHKREHNSLSLAEAAEQSGLSAPTLSRIERQIFIPDLLTYYQICRWLEVSLETFFEKIEALAA